MPLPVYLKPLKTIKKLGSGVQWGTFDTETKDGLKGSEIFCGSISYMRNSVCKGKKGVKRELFTFQGTFKECMNHLITEQPINLIWVQNLDFEGRMLFDYCLRNGAKHFAIDAGKLLEFQITLQNDFKLQFRDSWQFLQSEQEKAEIAWGVPENLRKIDCKDLFAKDFTKWTTQDKQRVLDHNRNDTQALHFIMKKFRDFVFDITKLDMFQIITPASFAMKTFRTLMKEEILNPYLEYDKFQKKNNPINKDIEDFIRKSYFGGRVEAYGNPKWDALVCYMDINSLYPTVMYKNKFPVGRPLKLEKLDLPSFMYVLNRFEGFVQCKIRVPKIKVQPLPYQSNGKLIFPYGVLEGIWAFPEIRLALKKGCTIEQIHECYYFTESKYLFKDYIDKFYPLKKAATEQGIRTLVKLLLNSLYGKFGQRHERESPILVEINIEDIEEDCKVSFYDGHCYKHELSVSESFKPFMLVHIAAYVTSYARCLEYSYLDAANKVYYCDTDSFVIPIEDIGLYTITDDLGSLKAEWTGHFVCFAPKVYYYDGVDGKGRQEKVLKAKGISKLSPTLLVMKKALTYVEDPTNLLRGVLMNGFTITKYSRWKEGLNKGKVMGYKTVCRKQNLLNTKREGWDGISSQPICIGVC